MDVTTMHGIQKKKKKNITVLWTFKFIKKKKNITVFWTLNLSMEKIQENIKLP